MSKINLKLKKSLIGCTKYQKAVLQALGLRRREQKIQVADNSANRGQILKIQHLLDVQMEK